MMALIKKELRSFFGSPLFAVGSALWLFLTGIAFASYITQSSSTQLPEASVRGMVYFMAVVLLFISPFLTMRSFAEERRMGTIELLKTSPLTDKQIVLGKYTALFLELCFFVLITFHYPMMILAGGKPDIAPMILSYVGLILFGGALVALGMFASVLTKSQMISALIAFSVSLTLWFLVEVGGSWGEKLSIVAHLDSFSLGVLDLADLSYYLLVIVFFVFMTIRFLEAERWR